MFNFLSKAEPRVQHLSSVALFKDLSHRELSVVERLLHKRHYLTGEVIFDEGEEGQGIYITLEGEIGIFHPEQRGVPVLRLGRNSYFGEMALLDDYPRMAQARALTDCTLAVMFRGEFLELLKTQSRIVAMSFCEPRSW